MKEYRFFFFLVFATTVIIDKYMHNKIIGSLQITIVIDFYKSVYIFLFF